MKTIKLIALLIIVISSVRITNAQDTIKINKPVFWSTDINLGIKNQGEYGGAMLRLYREKSFVALGISGFNYVPKEIPSDYYGGPGINIFGTDEALNSNLLGLIGFGRYFPSAHQPARILIQADVALGKFKEAVNFRPADTGILLLFFAPLIENYEYDTVEGFTGGVHLLAKGEVCSRFVSFGLNLETFITTKATAFCAGVSFGFGQLRKKMN